VIVAVISSVLIVRITSLLDSTIATKINMAQKQRMLAQRIVTDAFMIDSAARGGDWATLKPTLLDLQQSTTELSNAQHELRSVIDTNSVINDHLSIEQEAFKSIKLPFLTITKSVDELNKLTISMIRRAPYIDAQTLDRVAAAKDEIAKAHAIYLPAMGSIIELDENEYKSEIATIIHSAKLGIAIIFLILGASILFVVEPTIHIIRRQLQDLDNATQRVKRADATRWRLLSNMGHEFRTPMNAVMGFADLLNEGSLSEMEHTRLTKSIYDASTQLTHLIETMLDMSAIESGQLHIVNDRCNPTQILTKIQMDSSSAAMGKQLTLNLNIDESCPQQITTDPKRLSQILYNLVDNAIKFTQEGQINIEARLLDMHAQAHQPIIEIKVIDSGIGIDSKNQKHIFDPFHQADDHITRAFGGAGLGLTVSRDLARALGGDLVVESIPGHGSTFTLTIAAGKLEAQTPDSTQASPPENTSLESCKMLIVDDAQENRMLLRHIFKRTGALIEFAHDGQQGIDAINDAIKGNTPYEIILMDMQMPVLDGYHATVQLRKQGLTIPIIALTAHALDGDREHCLNAGCDEYLSKPVNKELLLKTCLRLLNKQSHPNNQAA